MSRYQPYPEYKDSGVEWLGEVPAHWEVTPIYGMARSNTKTLSETALESEGSFEYIDISAVNHILGIADGEQVDFKKAPSRARRLAEEGDVIVSTVRTYLKAVAEVPAEKSRCVFSTGFAVLTPFSNLAPSILKWILLNDLLIQSIEAHSQGLSYPAINTSRLLRLVAALPPKDEQLQIATFLDRETTRIDTLVEKKQRFIELLEEKRQAVITQAVTKGLDPNVPMKDSGVEWIGEVPAHWEMVPLKYLADVDNSGCYGEEAEVNEYVRPVATTAQISPDGKFQVARMSDRSFTKSEINRFECYEGDILVVKSSGSAENIISGKAGLVDESTPTFVFSNFLMRLRPKRTRCVPGFIYRFLTCRVTYERVKQMCSATTYPNLQVPAYTAADVPSPPISEQARITSSLDRETTRIDTLIEKTRESIELLKERRSALITAAVTGKIDVREEVAP